MKTQRSINPEDLKDRLGDQYILDVRRSADRDTSPQQIPGAQWHDPGRLDSWIDALPKDRDIVLYCAHGRSISNSVVDALHARGLNACFIEGGFEGWKAAGGKTESV